MKKPDQEANNGSGMWGDFRQLIQENQAGFALVVLGIILFFSKIPIGFSIAAFGFGLLLVIIQELNNHQMARRKLERDDDENIKELKKQNEILQSELDERNSEITRMKEQILKLQEASDKSMQSERLKGIAVDLYDPAYGRSENVTVVDFFEKLRLQGLLTDDHYQEIMIKINKFGPATRD